MLDMLINLHYKTNILYDNFLKFGILMLSFCGITRLKSSRQIMISSVSRNNNLCINKYSMYLPNMF